MPSLYKRTLTQHGGSFEIILPKSWVDFYHLKKGDPLTMIVDDLLVLCPPGMEDKARKLVDDLEASEKMSDAFKVDEVP